MAKLSQTAPVEQDNLPSEPQALELGLVRVIMSGEHNVLVLGKPLCDLQHLLKSCPAGCQEDDIISIDGDSNKYVMNPAAKPQRSELCNKVFTVHTPQGW
jgi:hypothetical protein